MKRAPNTSLAIGVRHFALAPIVRAELRALADARDAEHPVTLSALMMRLIWASLVSEHTAHHAAPPSRADCAAYRLLAEYLSGDAIDSIDEKVAQVFANTKSTDPLLDEARHLKQITDALLAEEAARAEIDVEEMLSHAHRQVRGVDK
jgi:hypothetical protein